MQDYAPALVSTEAASPDEQHAAERQLVNLLGVGIDAVNMERALEMIAARIRRGRKGYSCAVSVHGILEALESEAISKVFAQAAFALPDGAPTVWVGRLLGHRAMNHVTGPSMMREIIRRPEFAHLSHFFYGGKPGIAEELAHYAQQERPGIRILGTCTPPFRSLTGAEELEFTDRINRLRPDIIWLGISTPKQDLFMHRMLPALDTRMMFGVGAAFDFLTGHVQECPLWVKRAGFSWCHRLLQDPKRLWRRNLSNSKFLWHIALQLTGLRSYPLRVERSRFAQSAVRNQ